MGGWLGVISAEHVRRARELGIVQINHGSRAGLTRMHVGDTVVYYSPTEARGDGVPLREFTAFGTVADDEIRQADEGDFRPFRRRADWADTRPVPLAEVRDHLHLTSGPNWGHQLRLGLVPLDDHDVAVLRGAMVDGA